MSDQIENTPRPAAPEQSNPVRDAAALYNHLCIAVCRLAPGEKIPTYPKWTTGTLPPDDFGPGDNIGIQCGALSTPVPGYSLVCVDLDSAAALERADAHLPPTNMVDGRPSKPRAHRYYLVRNESIPPEHAARAGMAAADAAVAHRGHPGPRIRHFNGVGIDFLGTGGQVAAPPSLHPSGERREWEGGEIGEPARAEFPELWAGVCALVAACGGHVADAGGPEPDDAGDDADADAPANVTAAQCAEVVEAAPMAEREARARRYLTATVAAGGLPRSEQGGEARSHRLARIAINDFALDPETAFRVLVECVEPALVAVGDGWGEAGWRLRVEKAVGAGPDPKYPRGCKLLAPASAAHDGVESLAPNDPTRLGAEYERACAAAGRPVRVRRDTAFRYALGRYAPECDDTLRADIRQFLVDKAAERYAADLRRHAARRAELEAEVAGAADAAAHRKAEKELERHDRKRPGAPAFVTRGDVAEVDAALRSLCRAPDDLQPGARFDGRPERGVAVANGWFNFDTWRLEPHDPAARFALARAATAYDPAARAPIFKALVSQWTGGDPELIALLQELAGAALDAGLTLAHFALFPGEGATGKSTFLHVLRLVLGAENVSAVPLDQLTGHRFAAYGLLGKFANVVADQGFFDSRDEGVLKQLTGFADLVQFEAKNKQPIAAVSTAKLMFACNTLPTFSDGSEGVWRRALIVPFRFVVPELARRAEYGTSEFWQGELSGVLNWMLEGLRRLHATGRFTRAAAADAVKAAHREASDPFREFALDCLTPEPGGFVSNRDVADAFQTWARANGHTKLADGKVSSITLNRAIARAFPAATQDKRRAGAGAGPVRGWAGLALARDNGTNAGQLPWEVVPPQVLAAQLFDVGDGTTGQLFFLPCVREES